jgi:hypothetical protein
MGAEQSNVYIGESEIQGKGLFSDVFVKKGRKIVQVLDDRRKAVIGWGHYVNHQDTSPDPTSSCGPTTTLLFETGKWYLVAIRNIYPFEELTTDYNDSRVPDWIMGSDQLIGNGNVKNVCNPVDRKKWNHQKNANNLRHQSAFGGNLM